MGERRLYRSDGQIATKISLEIFLTASVPWLSKQNRSLAQVYADTETLWSTFFPFEIFAYTQSPGWFRWRFSWKPVDDVAASLMYILLLPAMSTPYPIYWIEELIRQSWVKTISIVVDALEVPLGKEYRSPSRLDPAYQKSSHQVEGPGGENWCFYWLIYLMIISYACRAQGCCFIPSILGSTWRCLQIWVLCPTTYWDCQWRYESRWRFWEEKALSFFGHLLDETLPSDFQFRLAWHGSSFGASHLTRHPITNIEFGLSDMPSIGETLQNTGMWVATGGKWHMWLKYEGVRHMKMHIARLKTTPFIRFRAEPRSMTTNQQFNPAMTMWVYSLPPQFYLRKTNNQRNQTIKQRSVSLHDFQRSNKEKKWGDKGKNDCYPHGRYQT